MTDVILDALKDTAILFPFLFVMYILIEVMEHNTGVGKPNRAFSGKCAPLIGTATGIVPMCGFSVMAAKLYRHRHITLGTLLAVFIATSDEAFLVLLTSPASGFGWGEMALSVLAMVGLKLFLGIAVGYLADCFIGRKQRPVLEVLPVERRHDHEEHDHGEEAFTPCEHRHESRVNLYLVSPLLHALQVAAFVLIVNFLFGYLYYAVGEENVSAFLRAGYWVQPLVCCLIGLIPNCASSVVLAETYAVGGIAFGSCFAGLVVNAGLGYLALFRGAKFKRAFLILLFMFLLGVAVGYAILGIELTFFTA